MPSEANKRCIDAEVFWERSRAKTHSTSSPMTRTTCSPPEMRPRRFSDAPPQSTTGYQQSRDWRSGMEYEGAVGDGGDWSTVVYPPCIVPAQDEVVNALEAFGGRRSTTAGCCPPYIALNQILRTSGCLQNASAMLARFRRSATSRQRDDSVELARIFYWNEGLEPASVLSSLSAPLRTVSPFQITPRPSRKPSHSKTFALPIAHGFRFRCFVPAILPSKLIISHRRRCRRSLRYLLRCGRSAALSNLKVPPLLAEATVVLWSGKLTTYSSIVIRVGSYISENEKQYRRDETCCDCHREVSSWPQLQTRTGPNAIAWPAFRTRGHLPTAASPGPVLPKRLRVIPLIVQWNGASLPLDSDVQSRRHFEHPNAV
ncbi:hypothetical protein C8F01DRAFT_1229692 [Mycena amicta]|nr:hypothetical protein C8F01DRAFT_1229692 [Mycena amicta]